MDNKSKKVKPYPIDEGAKEVAVQFETAQYETLRVIMGDNSIKNSFSGDFDLIDISRKGIKKSILKSFARHLGITMEALSGLLHSSYRNIQKDENELSDTLKTGKVLELAAFAQRGIEVIGSKESFAEWISSPLISPGSKAPLDFLDTSFGIRMVTKIFGRLEQGVYS